MLPKWVPLLRPRAQPRNAPFNQSLVQNGVAVLILTSLIPVLLMGIMNSSRSREMLRQQVTQQLETLLVYETGQVKAFVASQNDASDRLAADPNIGSALLKLLAAPDHSPESEQAKTALLALLQQNFPPSDSQSNNQAAILRPDGSVVISSGDLWSGDSPSTNLALDPLVSPLIGTSQSFFVFKTLQSIPDSLVLLTSRPLVDAQGAQVATFISISSSSLITRLLTEPGTILDGVTSYTFNNQGELYGKTESSPLAAMPVNRKMASALQSMIALQKTEPVFPSVDPQGTALIASAEWLPDFSLGILLTLPELTTVGPVNLVDPSTLLLLLCSLLLTSALIYFGSTRLVNPLVDLARLADEFSKGNWSERSPIQRSDEIGHLAASFNHMADDLSTLYQSLESAVDVRTSQLRTAAEVAQMALTTTSLGETLSQTIALISERFGFDHASIYLFDENRQNLILAEASGTADEQEQEEIQTIKASADSLIGWVALKNEIKIVSDPLQSHLLHSNTLLPENRSEIAVPVTLGNEVLGVLDIQSAQDNAFGPDTTFVFQTLATQISSILRNARLLELAQVSYEETALLYRSTRQIIEAQNKEEITQILTDTLAQMSFIGAVLSVEEEFLRMEAITDPDTRKIQTDLRTLKIPAGRMIDLLQKSPLVVTEDIALPSDFDVLFSFLLRRGCTSAAIVSVLENGQLTGVLLLAARESNLLTHSRIQLYESLAKVIGASLEKNQALETLQKHLSELQILTRLNQAISAETRLENLYPILHQQITLAFGPNLEFAVAQYSPQTQLINFPYFFEDGQLLQVKPIPLGQGLTTRLIESRQPLLLNSEQKILAQGLLAQGMLLSDRPAKSWLGIPLIFGGEVLGALIVQDLAAENRFTQDDLSLLVTLSPQIATAIRNTQLFAETQQALSAYDQERFLLNILLDNIPEGITFKNFHGEYIRTSETIARAVGLTAKQITGKTDYDLYDHETAELVFRKDQMVMNIGQPELGMVEHTLSQTGKEAWIHTSRIPIKSGTGDPFGLLLIQRDITDIKQAEALAQRRANQVMTASEIARDATSTLDLPNLLQKSVNLVRERFGFYHASIFLLDITGEYVELRESTGQAGQKMLKAGHRLAASSKSTVGQATSTGEAVIINNVSGDPTHLANPLLPDTKSELAIPLKVGKRILGVLDVQSNQIDAFNQEDVSILKILADQLAIALVNADLFAKTRDLLSKHRMLRQISADASASTQIEDSMARVVSGLHKSMPNDRILILTLNEEGELQVHASAGYEGLRLPDNREPVNQRCIDQVVAKKQTVRVNDISNDPRYYNHLEPDVRSELAVPILFNDEIIGILNLKSTLPYAFDENDQEIIGALGNNLGGVIANIRLVTQVRQQVLRERQLFDVTTKIRRSVDLETILEISAREIAQVLGARRASIRITAGDKEGQTSDVSGKTHDNGHGQQG